MDTVEIWVTRIGGLLGIATLSSALLGLWRAVRRPGGRESGQAYWMLRGPVYLCIGIPYFLVCIFLWKPLPLCFSSTSIRIATFVLGSFLYFLGLLLYLWSWFSLGSYYNVSSSFGVRLFEDHKLVTEGPYALVRHPMYLGIQMTALGGVFLFRVWTFVFLFVNFLFLVIRAHREEQALAKEYPDQWKRYCKEVPGWFPKLQRRKFK